MTLGNYLKGIQRYTEEELVASLQSRSQAGFSYLYDHYAGALFGLVRSIVPDEVVASDVLQEVFVKVWRNIDAYDPARGRLFTWMLQIARSSSLDMLRSKGWRNSQLNNSFDDTHIGQAGSTQLPLKDAGLRKIMQSLKTEHKEILELSYFQGYTQEEIARILEMPVGTVKTRLRAALTLLRKMIPG